MIGRTKLMQTGTIANMNTSAPRNSPLARPDKAYTRRPESAIHVVSLGSNMQ